MTKLRRPIRTPHQRAMMGIILREHERGVILDHHALYAKSTDYIAETGMSFDLMRKILEALEKQQMIVRERVGMVTSIHPTERGYDWFRPARD